MVDPQDDEDGNAALSGLQEVDDDEEVEPYFDGGDGYNADELDNAVEASDQAMVDKVTQEVTNKEAEWEESLTREDINLGWFSLSKVSYSQISISCF